MKSLILFFLILNFMNPRSLAATESVCERLGNAADQLYLWRTSTDPFAMEVHKDTYTSNMITMPPLSESELDCLREVGVRLFAADHSTSKTQGLLSSFYLSLSSVTTLPPSASSAIIEAVLANEEELTWVEWLELRNLADSDEAVQLIVDAFVWPDGTSTRYESLAEVGDGHPLATAKVIALLEENLLLRPPSQMDDPSKYRLLASLYDTETKRASLRALLRTYLVDADPNSADSRPYYIVRSLEEVGVPAGEAEDLKNYREYLDVRSHNRQTYTEFLVSLGE